MILESQLSLLSSRIQEEWALYLNEASWHPELKALALPRVGQGKCLRPFLLLMSYQSLTDSPSFFETRLIRVGLALEMLHTYSLVHDDLPCMDDDDFRRGLPTAHREAGEATALLLGDALLTGAFEVLAKSSYEAKFINGLVADLARFAGGAGMICGQQRDLRAEVSSIDHLKKLHEEKTGALFAFCIKAAALLALPGLKAEQLLIYEKFGQKLGLLFQVVDDLLDAGEEGPSFVSFLGLEQTKDFSLKIKNELIQESDGIGLAKLQPLIELFYQRKS